MSKRPKSQPSQHPPQPPPHHTYLGSGGGRHAYRRGNVVVKIPKDEMGVLANYSEWAGYRRSNPTDRKRLARCRYIRKTGWLVMIYVDPLPYEEAKKIEWTDFVDCRQVGTNRSGIVQAFDYAISNLR